MLISVGPHDLLPAFPARDGYEQRTNMPPPCFHALDCLVDQCFHVPGSDQHMHLEGSGREMPQFRHKAGIIAAPYVGKAGPYLNIEPFYVVRPGVDDLGELVAETEIVAGQ